MLFYKANTGWCADVVPFYKDGTYYLFYLHDYRDHPQHGEGTPWYLLTTTDFVHFTEHGEVIPRGGIDQQDLYIFTGCVVEDVAKVSGYQYHIYYTGHNPHFIPQGKPQEAVMHAVSHDLLHWEKLEDVLYFAPDGCEQDDWRDPFIWYCEESKEYQMLTAARHSDGPSRYRGFTARSTSKDLIHWQYQDAFYNSREYFTNECPDYFEWNGWHYLIFSEFTGEHRTHYRMSRSVTGPWLVPQDDFFDTRSFYAAKSAGDSSQRYLFGWNPTRVGEVDAGGWMWGSHLVIHRLNQREDGTLFVTSPPAVQQYFQKMIVPAVGKKLGMAILDGSCAQLDGTTTRAMVALAPMPVNGCVKGCFTFDRHTTSFGILLRMSDDLEEGYYLRYEPRNSRLVFDRWPKPVWDVPHLPETERHTCGVNCTLELEVYFEGTQLLAYLTTETGTIALSTRMYDRQTGLVGLFAQNGAVTVNAFELLSDGE